MSEKIFLKLNLDFIVAEIRGVFGSMGVYAWIEIVAATVFCSAKAQFWMISEAILIAKIYARLQEIASNFSKFSGEAFQTPTGARAFGARFGASPPYRAPLSKILGFATDISLATDGLLLRLNLLRCLCRKHSYLWQLFFAVVTLILTRWPRNPKVT